MATSNNILLQGLKGRAGDIVFRQRNGKTILCKRPQAYVGAVSKAQTRSQNRFTRASAYASRVMLDPELSAEFIAASKAKGNSKSPRNLAIADYYKIPVFEEWNMNTVLADQTLTTRFEVSFTAFKRIKGVTAMVGRLASDDPKLITLTERKDHAWTFALSKDHADAGMPVTITAIDRAGNRAELSITI